MAKKSKNISAGTGESDSSYQYINMNRKTSAKKRREQMAKDFKEAAKNSTF